MVKKLGIYKTVKRINHPLSNVSYLFPITLAWMEPDCIKTDSLKC